MFPQCQCIVRRRSDFTRNNHDGPVPGHTVEALHNQPFTLDVNNVHVI